MTDIKPGDEATLALTYAALTEPCTADGCENGTVSSKAWAVWHEREDGARKSWEAANPGGDWWLSAELAELDRDRPDEEVEWECPTCRGYARVPNAAGRAILQLIRHHG